jgi:cation transport regulator ChaB
MPYDNLSDLPDSVRNNLPKHAQEIYRQNTKERTPSGQTETNVKSARRA